MKKRNLVISSVILILVAILFFVKVVNLNNNKILEEKNSVDNELLEKY